jgi:hypothetical protein
MMFAVCTAVKVSITSFTDLETCFAGVRVYEPLKSGVSAALATINDNNTIETQAWGRAMGVTCITGALAVAINPRSLTPLARCGRGLSRTHPSRMLFGSYDYETDGKSARDYGPASGRVAYFAG